MIAVDTNVVVRVLLADDAAQTRAAERLFRATDEILISTTVALETLWVLTSTQEVTGADAVRVLRGLLALPCIVVDDAEIVGRALDLVELGLDVGDAFHLAGARSADSFATFDRRLVARAARAAVSPAVVRCA